MNAGNVIKLDRYVRDNKQRIVAENKTLAERSEEAATALGFKVSANAMSDVLKENGVATRRRSPHQVRIEQLTAERNKYREWLRKCVDTVEIRDWLLDEMAKDLAGDNEIVQAIRAKKQNGGS